MSAAHLKNLEAAYASAESTLKANKMLPKAPAGFSKTDSDLIDNLFLGIENNKGINNVLITSFVEKSVNPKQDIRIHQSKMKNGYSGRTLDTKVVVPFLKSKRLLTMVESGWLTRSLEQNDEYDKDYQGAIKPQSTKETFLEILDRIQTKGVDPKLYLNYYFQKLIVLRESKTVVITPISAASKLNIRSIIEMLERHIAASTGAGKSKLPVLAIFAAVEVLMNELSRYSDKVLKPLESHTSPDARSSAVGDVQIDDNAGNPYEGYEIKLDKDISYEMILDAYEKVKATTTGRYFILSTGSIDCLDDEAVQELLQTITDEHGCEVLVQDIWATLSGHLAAMSSVNPFIETYSRLIQDDEELKVNHKEAWNQIIIDSNYPH